MKLWFKKTKVPENNITKEVETVQLWVVEWYGERRSPGRVYSIEEKHYEAFTCKETAEAFRASLANAFKLVKVEPVMWPTVKKN